MTFTQKVKEALAYYVYALVDPRDKKIFYVGKGKGDRVFQHAQAAIFDEDDQSLKLNTIRDIQKEGLEVSYYILRHNLTEETAYIVESTLIDLLTYKDFNKENLLTNIASGHHQWDEGIKTIDEINQLYDCSKMSSFENRGTLLLVNLNRSYNQKKAKGVYKRNDIYECTRKYWRISHNRIREIKYVLGVYKGIVRAVYKPLLWQSYDVAEDGTVFSKTRYGFEGEEVPDSPYLNKDISDYPFGSGSAIRYI